jgi:hypothetical protein
MYASAAELHIFATRESSYLRSVTDRYTDSNKLKSYRTAGEHWHLTLSIMMARSGSGPESAVPVLLYTCSGCGIAFDKKRGFDAHRSHRHALPMCRGGFDRAERLSVAVTSRASLRPDFRVCGLGRHGKRQLPEELEDAAGELLHFMHLHSLHTLHHFTRITCITCITCITYCYICYIHFKFTYITHHYMNYMHYIRLHALHAIT